MKRLSKQGANKSQLGKNIFRIIPIAVSVMILLSMLTRCLEVDLRLISRQLGPVVRAGFNFGDEFVVTEEDRLVIRGSTLLESLDEEKGAMEKNSVSGKILRLLRGLILPLYALAAVTAVLAALGRRWSGRLMAVLSAVGLLDLIGGLLYLFPMLVSGRIPQKAIFIGLTPGKAEPVLRAAMADGLGIGWWIMAVGFGMLAVIGWCQAPS